MPKIHVKSKTARALISTTAMAVAFAVAGSAMAADLKSRLIDAIVEERT
jgi:hypothetical protein